MSAEADCGLGVNVSNEVKPNPQAPVLAEVDCGLRMMDLAI